MKLPSRTETADSAARLKRAHELDAQITQALANLKKVAADFADEELPEGYLDFNGLPEFLKTRGQSSGVKLTDADETGFRVIEWYLANGGVVSRDTILKILQGFNPARQQEATA